VGEKLLIVLVAQQNCRHLSAVGDLDRAAALCGRVFVCDGVFDALALMAAGAGEAVAVYGVDGWRPAWARPVRQLVLAMDADAAGERWRELAL